jgi:phosphoribosylglycinamide formyltransferase-1
VNIHPALLPKYGGKGMYGMRVHEAVLNNKEKESGITIHYVDGHHDNGDIILQAAVLFQRMTPRNPGE